MSPPGSGGRPSVPTSIHPRNVVVYSLHHGCTKRHPAGPPGRRRAHAGTVRLPRRDRRADRRRGRHLARDAAQARDHQGHDPRRARRARHRGLPPGGVARPNRQRLGRRTAHGCARGAVRAGRRAPGAADRAAVPDRRAVPRPGCRAAHAIGVHRAARAPAARRSAGRLAPAGRLRRHGHGPLQPRRLDLPAPAQRARLAAGARPPAPAGRGAQRAATSRGRAVSAVDGAIAAGAELATGELLAALVPGARSPVSGIGGTLIDVLPGPGVDIVVATAESADKPLLKGTLGAATLASGALAGRLGDGRAQRVLAGAGTAAGALTALRRESAGMPSFVAGAGAGAAAAGVLASLRTRRSRRARAAAAGAALLTGGAAAWLRRSQRTAFHARRAALSLPPAAEPAPPPPPGAELAIDGLAPLYTPADSFYVTDVQVSPPLVDPEQWRLRVHGMVDRPLELALDDLCRMGLVELDATLACVHNKVGGDRIGSARWLGVPLEALLDRAGCQADAEQVVARSVDGFTAGVPVELVRAGVPALLAIGMGGGPLPVDNGFPARLIVPGLWGADANTKWVAELELTTWGAVEDYWDARGWPRWPEPVKPSSRIDVPRHRALLERGPVTVAGVAWAPPDGVRSVEVSVDGGDWRPAELSAEVAPTMWRQWLLRWDADVGEHELRVRTAGPRAAQDGTVSPAYPDGTGGYHTIEVEVRPRPATPADRLGSAARFALDDARDRTLLAARAIPAWLAR